jgi:hypothetical protein
VFGLFSFIGHSDNDNKEPNSNQIKTWKFTPEDSLNGNESFFLYIDLEKTLISKYNLGIKYRKDKNMNIPMSAYSTTTGFISGTIWKPISIKVSKTDDNKKFEYSVDGIVGWKLLGATVYSQRKMYSGYAITK